jgi:hypothetical protein
MNYLVIFIILKMKTSSNDDLKCCMIFNKINKFWYMGRDTEIKENKTN